MPTPPRATTKLFDTGCVTAAPENALNLKLRVFRSQNRYPLLRNTRRETGGIRAREP
jgi:hypothetical protein